MLVSTSSTEGLTMRLATLQTSQGPRAVVRQGESYIDINATDSSLPNSVREWLAQNLLSQVAAVAVKTGAKSYPVRGAQFHAPIPDPQKVICIGLNYSDHAAEQNLQPPKEPVVFSKFVTALTGHEKPVELPSVSTKEDSSPLSGSMAMVWPWSNHSVATP